MGEGGDKRGEEEYKNLKNAFMERYKFDEKYQHLDETDLEFAIDKVIETKATQQSQEINEITHTRKIKMFEDEGGGDVKAGKKKIHEAGDIKESDNASKQEKKVQAAWKLYDNLTKFPEDTEDYKNKLGAFNGT